MRRKRMVRSAAALASACFVVLLISAFSFRGFEDVARHPWLLSFVITINSPSILIASRVATKSAKPMAVVMILFMIVHATSSFLLTLQHDKGLLGVALLLITPVYVPAILVGFAAVGLLADRAAGQINGGFHRD